MNKSKFLKKSLAALLAVMLVVAMIPLSAAAANDYKPTDLKIVGPAGEVVTGSGRALTLNLNYTPSPTVTISTGNPNDDFVVIREQIDGGNQVGSENENYNTNPATIPLQVDADKKPVLFRFYIVNGSSRTEDYTIDWTVASPASTGTATKAVFAGQYEGDINEANKTITFTVPFGYATSGGDKGYYVDFDGCTTSRITVTDFLATGGATPTGGTGTATGTGKIGTHQVKTAGQLLTAETQDGKSDVQYTVYVNEEAGLTEFKVGDLATEIEISTTGSSTGIAANDGDADATVEAGMQTGVIKVYVPSTLVPVDNKVKLTPTFSISDPNTSATIQNGSTPATNKADVVSGKEFDFSYAYCGQVSGGAVATSHLPAGVNLTLTSTNGAFRIYKLIFVRDEDVELTSVTAVDGTARWNTVDGTIDGDNIEIIVPKTAALNDVDLTFTGPRNFAGDQDAKVEIKGTNSTGNSLSAQNFDTAGVASAIEGLSYTKPVQVVVSSENGAHQKVYTLTIKPIEEDTVAPAITSGILVLKKGSSDEAKYDAVITQGDEPTITFTVPHNTTNDELKVANNAVYTWARNSKATTVTENHTNGFGGADYVLITAASGNSVKYKIVFKRAPARTGKGISDFVLSTETTHWKLIEYNNNHSYNVTVNNGQFTVTVPDKNGPFSGNFKLDDGAKLYKWTNDGASPNKTLTAVLPVSSDGDTINMTRVNPGAESAAKTEYFVASEELATMIDNLDKRLLVGGAGSAIGDIDVDIIMNKYSSMISKYTWNVKEQKSNLTRLSSFTDVQGNVKADITSTKEGKHVIELTVPHSYVTATANLATGKWFNIDFNVTDGATLGILPNQETAVAQLLPVYDCGKKNYTTKVNNEANAWGTNPAFCVEDLGNGSYQLRAGDSTTSYPITNTEAGVSATGRFYVLAEDQTTLEFYQVTIKKAAAKSGAQVTELTVNGSQATIDQNAKTITANVPFGTNLGQIKVALKASDMAQVGMGKTSITANPVTGSTVPAVSGVSNLFFDKEVEATYDLRTPLKIQVRSESTLPQVVNTYTLTVKTGEQFTDVPANAWFAPYVKEAFDKGIVQGIGEGQFGPYTNITREDFVVMTGRMLNVKVDADADVPFTDASSVADYAKPYVAYFATNGVVGGVGDGSFNPKANITRQEAAKILSEALALEITGTPTFADSSSIASWAVPYVAACQKAGIFNGDENNNFNGTKMITRAETAKVMVDSLKIK